MLTIEERIARFYERVERSGGPDACWPWTGSQSDGYGRMKWEGFKSAKKATHIALYLTTGRWPKYVEHDCDVPVCCNPAHLRDTSHEWNMASMANRRRMPQQQKTHCPAGHSYEEHGKWVTRGDGRRFRRCHLCMLADTHRRRGPERKVHTGPRRKAIT